MAWIKMRCDLSADPRVLRIATDLGTDPDLIVGKLFRLWAYADAHTEDGRLRYLTPAIVGQLLACPGLVEALVTVGWLVFDADGAVIPHFDEHNGETAKARALTARRVARFKAGNGEVTLRALPREEKIREEKKKNTSTAAPPTTPPAGANGARAPKSAEVIADLVGAWNDLAGRYHLATVTVPLNAKRRVAVQARLAEHSDEDWWIRVLRKIPDSHFLTGATGWRVTFDFLIKPGNAEKILEGQYDNTEGRYEHSRRR